MSGPPGAPPPGAPPKRATTAAAAFGGDTVDHYGGRVSAPFQRVADALLHGSHHRRGFGVSCQLVAVAGSVVVCVALHDQVVVVRRDVHGERPRNSLLPSVHPSDFDLGAVLDGQLLAERRTERVGERLRVRICVQNARDQRAGSECG